MAEADLDVVIRQIAKTQNKNLIAAVKKRRDQIMARAAKAKDKETRDRFRLIAKSTMELGTAAARRLQNSAEITRRQLRPGHQGRGRGSCRSGCGEEASQEERRLKQPLSLRRPYGRGKYRARIGDRH